MSGYVPLNERPQGGHARLLAMALVDGPGRVLDVGCSSGYLARPLSEAGATIVGVELDPVAAQEARAVCEEVLVGDVETIDLPFSAFSFDVVLCGDVIEHLREPAPLSRACVPCSDPAAVSSSPRRTSRTGLFGSRSSAEVALHGSWDPGPHAHPSLHA